MKRKDSSELPAAKTPCERLALAQAQLDAAMSGKSIRAVETPQLGRVEYQATNIADLHRLIATLKTECAESLGLTRLRRRPISVEVVDYLPPRDAYSYDGSSTIQGPPGPPGPQGEPGAPGSIAYGNLQLLNTTIPAWPSTIQLLSAVIDIPTEGEFVVEVRAGFSIEASSQEDVVIVACNGRVQSVNFGKQSGIAGILSSTFTFSIPAPAGPFTLSLEAGGDGKTYQLYGVDSGQPWRSFITWAAAETQP